MSQGTIFYTRVSRHLALAIPVEHLASMHIYHGAVHANTGDTKVQRVEGSPEGAPHVRL